MIVENCTDQKIQWTQSAVTHSDHCFSNAVWWFLEPATVVFELLISIQSNQLEQKLISNTAPIFHPMHSYHKHHLPSRSCKPSCQSVFLRHEEPVFKRQLKKDYSGIGMGKKLFLQSSFRGKRSLNFLLNFFLLLFSISTIDPAYVFKEKKAKMRREDF